MEGWIKLHRQIKDHWLWKSDNRFKWWVDILLTVNHTDSKVLIKGTLIECKRGQSIRSLESWAKEWNVSKGAVRDFFKLLQSDQMLQIESLQFTTRITVCNYEDYQDELNAKETQKKRKENAEETLALPKQECKEGEECKEEKEIKRKKKIFNPPVLDEVKSYFKENGYPERLAIKFYESYSVADWIDSKGNPVRNWKQKALNVWFRDENKDRTLEPKQKPKLAI